MRRREFIAALGSAALWPLAARAQQVVDRVRRIAILVGLAENDPQGQATLAALVQALQQLGWIDGRNVRIDYRWGGGNVDNARQIRGGTSYPRSRCYGGHRWRERWVVTPGDQNYPGRVWKRA
jgi:hypothetical protein